MKLDQIIAEADAVIEKRAAKTQVTPAVLPPPDDDTVKLASFLENFEEPKIENQNTSPFQMTFGEKLASAVAMVEAINNMEEFQKIAAFEAKAVEAGYTQEQVEQFLEKKALKIPSSVALPAIAAIAAGTAGHLHGRKKGYNKAMTDVDNAFAQAAQANG